MIPWFTVGDTFSYGGTVELLDSNNAPLSLAGATLAAQLRTQSTDVLIADLTVTFDGVSVILLRNTNTAAWPIGMARIDVEATLPGGDKISTPIGQIDVRRDVTRP